VGKNQCVVYFQNGFRFTFLKIVLLMVPVNCKHFASLDSSSLENWYDDDDDNNNFKI
jgi:maltodextrin utilization protein YvdJ